MTPLGKPVTVAELSDSGLIRERWIFSLQGQQLVLDRYYYERRYTKKQQFKALKFYDRGRDPEEDYGSWRWLTEAEVPWDDELPNQALSELAGRIRVVRQSEMK